MEALTVQQLIDLLSEVEDKSLPVWIAGWFCECNCEVEGISVENYDNGETFIMIEHVPCNSYEKDENE